MGLDSFNRVAAITCLHKGFYPFTQLSKVTRLLSGLDSYSRLAAFTCLSQGGLLSLHPAQQGNQTPLRTGLLEQVGSHHLTLTGVLLSLHPAQQGNQIPLRTGLLQQGGSRQLPSQVLLFLQPAQQGNQTPLRTGLLAITCLFCLCKGFYHFTQLSKVTKLLSGLDSFHSAAPLPA